MAFTLKLAGVESVLNKLQRLETGAPKAVAKALRAGAAILAAAEKTNIHSRSGALAKSVHVKSLRSRGDRAAVIVTTSGDDGLFHGKTFYGGFVELGHKQGRRALGNARKQIAPRSFAAKAAQEKAGSALTAIENEVHLTLLEAGLNP